MQPLIEDISHKSKEKETNPYMSIYMDRFAIVPAVPGLKIPQRTTKSVPLDIPVQFNALPAEPTLPTAIETLDYVINVVDISDYVQVVDLANSVDEDRFAALSQNTPVYEDVDFLSTREERKQFKRCHGKCVQKFCLPVGSLSVFDKCTNKCKGICTQ